ncbi:MAG: hypothetical protein J6Y43_02650, partial [Clostridia bacterium]|nr:hypothetical protein [Clostridia bacterium]
HQTKKPMHTKVYIGFFFVPKNGTKAGLRPAVTRLTAVAESNRYSVANFICSLRIRGIRLHARLDKSETRVL